MKKEYILILDFGSQYTHLIKARLLDIGVNSLIEAGDTSVDVFNKENSDKTIKGIILSGGAQSVYDKVIKFDKGWFEINTPILGICYGHQLLANELGGKVNKSKPEFGHEELFISDKSSKILKGLPERSVVWMSHGDTVSVLPKGFKTVANTKNSTNTTIENAINNYYGVQFHPEVSHTEEGQKILRNFSFDICNIKLSNPWNPEQFIKETIEKYRLIIKNNKIIFGLSGGVDSMTMASILRLSFPKEQLLAVYIDTGLMPNETEAEVKSFCKDLDIPLLTKDSSVLFYKKLVGVVNPTKKGKIIGKVFIQEFEKIAIMSGAKYFAQGTIWSDVIESGVTKFSSQIKPHHNVGGLPKKMNMILIEPLRELFKDKVRELAAYMKLPTNVVNKKVFPGPGFAIRVQGDVTKKKVDLVRKCTKIIEDIVYNSEISDDVWMAFAILVEVPSLGVKGDKRIENKLAIVVRIVESTNSMTVNFSQKAFQLLSEISGRIVKETSIGRVVYDITNKPPATIEWQ